jgi:serine/threonine protein kinase
MALSGAMAPQRVYRKTELLLSIIHFLTMGNKYSAHRKSVGSNDSLTKDTNVQESASMYGEYYSIAFLHKGTSSQTILARKPNDTRLYTLKVISNEHRERNLNEVSILRDLSGIPNIAQYVEHFDTEQNLIIVCEYCKGIELFEYICNHERMSEPDAKYIFKQLCTAMVAAHKKGVIHRDLKPENIIINDSKVTIIDWGLSFYPDRTAERVSCGSPNYASPEIITSDCSYNGSEVDVWGLGCVLYTMLTASMPFRDEYIPYLFDKIRKCQVIYPEYIPEEAVDLLKQIFVRENRVSLEEILNGQWLNQ